MVWDLIKDIAIPVLVSFGTARYVSRKESKQFRKEKLKGLFAVLQLTIERITKANKYTTADASRTKYSAQCTLIDDLANSYNQLSMELNESESRSQILSIINELKLQLEATIKVWEKDMFTNISDLFRCGLDPNIDATIKADLITLEHRLGTLSSSIEISSQKIRELAFQIIQNN